MLQSNIIDYNMSVPADDKCTLYVNCHDYIDLQLQRVKYTLKSLNVNTVFGLDGVCSRILQAVYNIIFNLYVTNIIINLLLTLKLVIVITIFK